jgi:uncharacterized protein
MTAQVPSFLPAISLYKGEVMHMRLKPRAHRFSYKVFSLLVDLRQLDEAHRASRFFSVNRFNLLSFYPQDHGAGKGDVLDHVAALLAPHQIDISNKRVLLLCYPRVLGFVFNPISIYYIYYSDETLAALIYEVRNTFGGLYSYVCPVKKDQVSAAGIRQDCAKELYVSPFMNMNMHYHFRLTLPGERLHVRILEKDAEGPVLAATFAARHSPLTTISALKAFLGLPFMTLKVMVAIHWHAYKLWRKGVPLQPKPIPLTET